MIGNRVCCYPEEPGRERDTAPLELAEICQSLMKGLRGKVLRCGPAWDPARDVSINAFEVDFVQLGKAARVFLCRLDQPFFVVVIAIVQD
jgi:hypothetical protein